MIDDLREVKRLTRRIRKDYQSATDLSHERRQILVRLHDEGVTLVELADACGVNRSRIVQELRKVKVRGY